MRASDHATIAPSPRHRALAPLLAALAMFGPFAIDTMFPAFPAIAAELAATPLAMQQTISVYMIAYAVMSLLHGPLSDALGRRPVILAGVALFAIASVGCATAETINQLLAWRAVQGISAGAGLIVGRAIIRDCFEGADAQRLMSTVTMIFGLAPAIAPIIGGWVIAHAHWSKIFWLLMAYALVLWGASFAWLPETHPRDRRLAFSARAMLAGYAGILGDRLFFPLVFAGTLGFNALFVYIASAPVFVLELLGLGAQQFAWLFIPAIGGIVIGSFLSGRLAGRLDAASTVRLGFAIMLAACAINIGVAFVLPRPMVPWSVLPVGLHSLGAAVITPTLTLQLLDRFPRHRGSAGSLQSFISLLGSAAVAGAISPLVSHSALALACTAAGITVLAFIAWRVLRAMESAATRHA